MLTTFEAVTVKKCLASDAGTTQVLAVTFVNSGQLFLGTVTFAIVNQGIYFTTFDRNWSSLIIGVMLLLAVLMNNTFRIMALTYSPKKKKGGQQ